MITVETKGGVGRVTLNRPEVRNAFDDALIAELTKTFKRLDGDASVRAVVLAGNGPAFCAGADLNWMKRMAGYGYDENLRDARGLAEMLSTLDRMDKPTLARVHGPAFAGGTGLVAACDIAVGTPEAKFVVDRYVDEAAGVLERTWMSKVTLRPRVTFSGSAPSDEQHRALHHKAHEKCYIANSIKSAVTVEPSIDNR